MNMDDKVRAVSRMQTYIERHIDEDISFLDLSKVSLYSPWYARRIFIELLGVTPAEYIRKLQLKNAALRLRDEKVKILDVALDCGFTSVDGFQRAFYKEFGINPKDYALSPVPIPLFISYNIETLYGKENKGMNTKNVFIQVVEKPARKVIIKRGIKATHYFDYCEEVGCDVWGILVSIKSSIAKEPVCLWLPKNYIKEGTSEYVQGVEVSPTYSGPIPEGFDVIELPSSKYLMFQGDPFEEKDFEQAIQEIWEAEKKYDPSIIGYKWDEANPRIQLEPIGTRGYIELLPIK